MAEDRTQKDTNQEITASKAELYPALKVVMDHLPEVSAAAGVAILQTRPDVGMALLTYPLIHEGVKAALYEGGNLKDICARAVKDIAIGGGAVMLGKGLVEHGDDVVQGALTVARDALQTIAEAAKPTVESIQQRLPEITVGVAGVVASVYALRKAGEVGIRAGKEAVRKGKQISRNISNAFWDRVIRVTDGVQDRAIRHFNPDSK